MPYKYALETAGAKVHAFGEFGSYEGDWWARVTWRGGTGWAHGPYELYPDRDAPGGEFYLDDHKCGGDSHYNPIFHRSFRAGCGECRALRKRFAEFGRGYLGGLLTQEEAEAKAARNLDWDIDTEEMVRFIQDNHL